MSDTTPEWGILFKPGSLLSTPTSRKEMSDFRREDRYRVFKLSDIEAAKQRHPHKADDIEEALLLLHYATSLARHTAGKGPLACCVVESDWRCYESVWSLVEAEHEENAWIGKAES